MNENNFYNHLVQRAQNQETEPFEHSWEILESMLDEHDVKRKIHKRTILSVAAAVMLLVISFITLQKDDAIHLEGPLTSFNEPKMTTWINKSPIKYDRIKDYDTRVNNNIRVVRNVNEHLRYADLVEATTQPYAFHPEDYMSRMEKFKENNQNLNFRALSGNWYLHLAEGYFNKILELNVLDELNWNISTEAIEPAHRFLRIPGQDRYFVRQSGDGELVIIEILDESTIIMKKFNAASNHFDEAIYLKKDIR